MGGCWGRHLAEEERDRGREPRAAEARRQPQHLRARSGGPRHGPHPGPESIAPRGELVSEGRDCDWYSLGAPSEMSTACM